MKKWPIQNQNHPKLLIIRDDTIKDSMHNVSLAIELLKGALRNKLTFDLLVGKNRGKFRATSKICP
jgi:hypothetical protein